MAEDRDGKFHVKINIEEGKPNKSFHFAVQCWAVQRKSKTIFAGKLIDDCPAVEDGSRFFLNSLHFRVDFTIDLLHNLFLEAHEPSHR